MNLLERGIIAWSWVFTYYVFGRVEESGRNLRLLCLTYGEHRRLCESLFEEIRDVCNDRSLQLCLQDSCLVEMQPYFEDVVQLNPVVPPRISGMWRTKENSPLVDVSDSSFGSGKVRRVYVNKSLAGEFLYRSLTPRSYQRGLTCFTIKPPSP